MSIRLRLSAFILVMIALVGLMAWVSLEALGRMRESLLRQHRDSQEVQHALHAMADATSTFKTGVQEWKNLLLRGHDPTARTKYAQELRAQAEGVRQHLAVLEGLADQVNVDPRMIGQVRQGLDTLLTGYEEALAAWKDGDPLAYRAADAAVKGKDRPIAKALTELWKAIDASALENQRQAAEGAVTAYESGRSTQLAFTGGIALAAILLGIGFTLSVRRPLERLRHNILRLAAHDTHRAVPDQGRRDEIGQMAVALESLRQGLEAEQAVTAALQERVQDLTRAAEGLVQTGTLLTAAAGTSNRQAASVATASRDTSDSVSAVAAAAEEMSASISEISSNSGRVSDAVAKAVEDARQAAQMVEELAKTNSAISEVAKTIADIAARTNLLALNASIEAASAGEAGRGFSVVAGEVKALARQTAESTSDITSQLAEVGRSVQHVVEAIQRMGLTIEEINTLQNAITTALQSQNEVTCDIGQTIIKISASTHAISEAIAEVSASAGTTEASARTTHEAADHLTHLAGAFAGLAERLHHGSRSRT